MKLNICLMSAFALAATASAETPLYLNQEAPMEERINDALSQMTMQEKVDLCHARGKFFSPGVARLGIPGLNMSDGPHGVRAEINWNDWKYAAHTNDSVTAFPALTALAATWNTDLATLYGRCLGEEALYRGKNVMLGPGVNIYRTPLNGRNFEYLGEDPFLAGELAKYYIKALQDQGVAACVKHFALNNQEQWRGDIDVAVSDRALYEIYLPAFKKAVTKGGAWSIMGAYNRFEGQHCCHNARLLNDILRGEWGFDGAVITDWGGAHDTRQAAENGLDIEMGSYTNGLTTESRFGYDDYYLANPYIELLKSGQVSDSTLNAKASNVLRLIFRSAMNPDRGYGSIASADHYAAAKRIADESIVLLKNNDILPLDPAKVKKVLVVGENATRPLNFGGGSSELKVKDMFTPLEAIKNAFETVDYAKGYESGRWLYNKEDKIAPEVQDSLRNEALAHVSEYDAVIYIGGLNKNGFQDSEASDRRSYNLPYSQDELIEGLISRNPNTIVANVSGNAYAMPWLDKAPAVIQSWYLGTMIGPAMADVITGKTNPSGRLPFTINRQLTDYGSHSLGEISYPGIFSSIDSLPRQEYLDDIFVGYRHNDKNGIKPLFPFGYGLSYSGFKYSRPEVSATDSTLVITIEVKNISKVDGKETIQLYIGDDESTLPRPVKELKHFAKLDIPAGASSRATFTITRDDLKFFDDTLHQWIAEPGTFKAYIGSSAADIHHTIPFRLDNNSKIRR